MEKRERRDGGFGMEMMERRGGGFAMEKERSVREYIELLLWAMEQTNSPNPIMRERWWEYQSQMAIHQRLKDRASTGCRL